MTLIKKKNFFFGSLPKSVFFFLLGIYLTSLFITYSILNGKIMICLFIISITFCLLYLNVLEFKYELNYNLLLTNFEWFFFCFICLISFYLIWGSSHIIWAILVLELQGFLIFGSCKMLQNKHKLMSVEGSYSYLIPSFTTWILILLAISTQELIKEVNIIPQILFIIALMVKLGVVPFHVWVGVVIERMSIGSIILLTFINKLSVIVLLVCYLANFWYITTFLGLSSIILGSLFMFNTPRIRELLAYSSVVTNGWICLITSLNITPLEEGYNITELVSLFYFIYFTSTILFILGFSDQQKYLMDLTIKDNTEFRKVIMKNLIVWLSLLSMAGIPPLGGFIAKLLALKSFFNYFSVLVILIIIIFTIIAVVVYIRPIMTKDWSFKRKNLILPFYNPIKLSYSYLNVTNNFKSLLVSVLPLITLFYLCL